MGLLLHTQGEETVGGAIVEADARDIWANVERAAGIVVASRCAVLIRITANRIRHPIIIIARLALQIRPRYLIVLLQRRTFP